jgi:hypothetical protein
MGESNKQGRSLARGKIEVVNLDQALKFGLTSSRVLTALESQFYEKMSLQSPVRFRTARFDSHGL